MNRSDIVASFAHRHDISKKCANQLVSIMLDEMKDALAQGGGIEFRGFGSFFVKQYEGRQAKNPKSGEKVWMNTRKKVRFRPSKTLLSNLNDSLM
ncbi:MAG: integration host factor subunit beta [Deltaproteobacteria bacterium]|nr:integration host factor subunit beta [Deltaproteobacteria bacterium]